MVILLILVPLLLTASVSRGQQASPPCAAESQQTEAHRSISSAVEKEVEFSIAKAGPLLQRYGYAASFVAVMGEGIDIPLPGGS